MYCANGNVREKRAGKASIMPVRTKHLSGTVLRERSAAGAGPALWSPADPDGDRHYLWPGRGAGLFLVDGGGIVPVTDPAASGRYGGLKQARGALARLLAGRPAPAQAMAPALAAAGPVAGISRAAAAPHVAR
jgi:hypothetical protein